MLVELEKSTFATLIAGIYCTAHQVEPIAIPEELWMSIAEKLDYFLLNWDYNKITFEEWVASKLLVCPKQMLDNVEELMENTFYWEYVNGNVVLSVSMDIRCLNE